MDEGMCGILVNELQKSLDLFVIQK